MNVNLTPLAIADLRHIHRQIAKNDPMAADRVISRIRQIIEIFESFPLMGRVGDMENTREFAISGLPYTIVYRIISASELDILTIVHNRQNYPPQPD
ncbi:addiction module RelE/StbE family toxin [Neorhizobium sp. JUb45]|nr:type II toxin-antitoxin system RelE/ParE family toxin [Neorhizobium sp. JUb45]TCR04654.1 addiction module RelE/StbE family toxin [Neorhizobium sp. JUb45]